MASHNEYDGYVKLPHKQLYHDKVRFDFNPHIRGDNKEAKIEGFTIRMFTLKKNNDREQPEISVKMTAEQWLDLIDAMKKEFEQAQEARTIIDDEE
ncbi:hypothetical protein [Pelagicoccus sp. SDUM812002]|uniref:hypothetical protein n=1 Tax=Pelagicoccus sp. SDUM812002 TaxID=3041266 RepID=UPI00281026A1|nr:hypothetical protein [Pelagicoccus sp. SDUM812002]MDQ8188576.1 hypothetical protein [Pelagicoccus sp. SDUM812002]